MDLSADGARASGLAPTSAGVAVVLQKDRQNFIAEYGPTGELLRQTPIRCSARGDLLNLGGHPATICADGAITEYRGVQTVSRSSWARSGAIVQPLSANLLVIIDQSTAQVVLNDIAVGTLTVLEIRAPELDDALARSAAARVALEKKAAAADVRDRVSPGRQLVVMDTTADSSGWYMLLWPYHQNSGPAVVKVDRDGHVLDRLRCRLPTPATAGVHKLEVQMGHLLLVSVRGDVFRYKM